MKSRYQTIIYFIVATILVTIGIQVYWNFIHYKANKIELINQVQSSLNQAVETYYAEMAKSHVVNLSIADSVNMDGQSLYKYVTKINLDTLFDQSLDKKIIGRTIKKGNVGGLAFSGIMPQDSMHLINQFSTIIQLDSMHRIDELATKIIVSITNDTLELVNLSEILADDFTNKNWPIEFGLIIYDYDCVPSSVFPCDSIRSYGIVGLADNPLKVVSKSAYLPSNSTLEIQFSNISNILFQKSLVGMLLSLALSIAIVGCLIFLLRIIRSQKQLAEIKNDLISNITHEFKTPITTISTALQAIENFNDKNDKTKTKNYLSISTLQLEKLNLMVEKLLETASLDSDQLTIQREPTDLVQLLQQISEKHQLMAKNKIIELKMDTSITKTMVDPFHFENAVTNLVDNALKYGGEIVTMVLTKLKSGFEISISDNGSGIDKHQQELVFEKFYRVSQGNIHNIKGFGIGLYYCKKIIEKHGGVLSLSSRPGSTTFKIIMDGKS